MLKVLCLLALAAVTTAALCVWQPEPDRLVVDSNEVSSNKKGERIYQGQLFAGEVLKYYDSGAVERADQYVEGRRHGYSRFWFENGVLGSESYYENSRRQNHARTWWPNGTLKSESFYINGRKEGEAWSWYYSGAKYKRANFSEGQPTGLQQGWRENGDLFSNFEYKNGRVYGLNKANTCMGIEDETLSPDYYKDQSS